MMEAKNWRYFLISHQYQIAQLKLAMLSERMEKSDQLLSFLLTAYKDLLKAESRSVHRPQEGAERMKVARPVTGRSLARHHTVRHVGAVWTHDPEFKRSVKLERSVTKGSILENHENSENEPDLSLRKLAKTVISSFHDLETRLNSLFSTYQSHEMHINLLEQAVYAAHRKEMEQWTKLLSEIQGNFDRELSRKKAEIRKLNGTLAVWVHRYLDLEQKGGFGGGEMTERLKRVVESMEKQAYRQKPETEATQRHFFPLSRPMCAIDLLPGDQNPSQEEDF